MGHVFRNICSRAATFHRIVSVRCCIFHVRIKILLKLLGDDGDFEGALVRDPQFERRTKIRVNYFPG